MGNQQPQKIQQSKVQEIKQTQMIVQNMPIEEVKFVQQIQQQNEKNVNQRKSINTVLEQKSNLQPSLIIQPKLLKKQPSKKQLPPLKLKNMKSNPLGNYQNFNHQTSSNFEELQELRYDKIGSTISMIQKSQTDDDFEDKESQAQKQNNDVAVHLRPKKFRPSQITLNLKKLNYTSVSTTAEVSGVQQMPQINVL